MPANSLPMKMAALKRSRYFLAGQLLFFLLGCAGDTTFQPRNSTLSSVLGGSEPARAVPSHAVADIGITRCDQLTTDAGDPDRVPGVAPVKWEKLDAIAAIAACEQALVQHPGQRRLQAQLARAYKKARRFDDAFAVANEAASAGSIHGLYQLGGVYSERDQDYDKAIAIFKRTAEAGHVASMVDLGWRLYSRDGWGDRRAAMSWLQKAAAAGNVPSMAGIGDMYVLMDKQFEKAFPWYQRAATQGHAHAQLMIGRYYALGFSPVAKDPDRAAPYFERAAKSGDPRGGVQMARLYLQEWYSPGGVARVPTLEAQRKEKILYWLEYGMPKLSVR